jgi:putative FmdB family regulatory protein
MPIYEYACPQCGAEFEKLVRGGTAVACPSCQSARVIRRISVIGIKTDSGFTGGSSGGQGGCCGGGCGCH